MRPLSSFFSRGPASTGTRSTANSGPSTVPGRGIVMPWLNNLNAVLTDISARRSSLRSSTINTTAGARKDYIGPAMVLGTSLCAPELSEAASKLSDIYTAGSAAKSILTGFCTGDKAEVSSGWASFAQLGMRHAAMMAFSAFDRDSALAMTAASESIARGLWDALRYTEGPPVGRPASMVDEGTGVRPSSCASGGGGVSPVGAASNGSVREGNPVEPEQETGVLGQVSPVPGAPVPAPKAA